MDGWHGGDGSEEEGTGLGEGGEEEAGGNVAEGASNELVYGKVL